MKNIIIIILLFVLSSFAKDNCHKDNKNCLSVGKNYCIPLIRISGDSPDCECQDSLTTKVVINDLRNDFIY